MTDKFEVDLGEIRQITSWLAASDIGFIEVSKPGATVRLTLDTGHRGDHGVAPERSAAPASAAPTSRAPQARSDVVRVTAQTVGIFLATHPARSTPLVAPGTRVEPGDVIGLLQVAQLCLPVVAPAAGVVSQCLVAPGTKVGYATSLFEISPTA
jgi:acetyl-CoA carboxylase biotin carboxyl carrier protein